MKMQLEVDFLQYSKVDLSSLRNTEGVHRIYMDSQSCDSILYRSKEKIVFRIIVLESLFNN